jgi:hypothetical protein
MVKCLQRYIVLGYQKRRKSVNFKTNNTAVQATPREQNLISIIGGDEIAEQMGSLAIGLAR